MIRRQNLIGLILLILASPFVRAANFSYNGTFAHDTDLQYFTFTLANPTQGVTLRTWSYSGGTNADGQVIPSGGFEPYLNLYMADGTQMNPGTVGPCGPPNLPQDPTTGGCDVYYPTTVSFPGGVWDAGTYTLVLSTFANPGAGNLSDGFLAPLQGLPVPGNFTCQVGAPGYQGNPPVVDPGLPFCDEFVPGVERTGNWALDILNVDSATEQSAIPEPTSLSLALLGGLIILARLRRTRK